MGRWHPVEWLRSRPRTADLLLALLVTALGLMVHLLVEVERSEPDGRVRDPALWTVVLTLLATFPVYWRRTHTYVATGVVITAQIVATALDTDGGSFLGVLVMLYSLGAHTVGKTRDRIVVVIVLAFLTLFVAGLIVDELVLSDFISSVIVLITAFVLGDNLRRRRERADSLVERAERAEREQQLLAERRVGEERARIARELHDVVAHSVSVMVIQAAAARRGLRSDPDRAEQTLTTLEDTGRATMNELRSILGVLRQGAEEAAATVPQPLATDIASLVGTGAELPIDLELDPDLGDVPSGTSLTAYRIVQEALTNVRRHAGPVVRVAVRVERDDTTLKVEVSDDGRGAAADRRDDREGFGLVGMQERAGAVGGSVRAGPRPGGGWVVRAELPLRPTGARRAEAAR